MDPESQLKDSLEKAGFKVKRMPSLRSQRVIVQGRIYQNREGCFVRMAYSLGSPVKKTITISIKGEGRLLHEEQEPAVFEKALKILKSRNIL